MLVATRPRAIEHVCDRGFLARGPVGCLHTFASARAVELAHELGLALVAVRLAILAADGVVLLGAEPVRVGFAGRRGRWWGGGGGGGGGELLEHDVAVG